MRAAAGVCCCRTALILALLALLLSEAAAADGDGDRRRSATSLSVGQNNEARNAESAGEGVGAEGADAEDVVVGSTEWWRREKEKASKAAGRKVWAWELDAPPGHPFYENKTETKKGSWEDSLQFPDPPAMPDILSMEPIPRPEMPEWWVPTNCGTLNLTHPLTRHCFPADGSHHHVCCIDIPLDEEIDDDSLSPSTRTLVQSIRVSCEMMALREARPYQTQCKRG